MKKIKIFLKIIICIVGAYKNIYAKPQDIEYKNVIQDVLQFGGPTALGVVVDEADEPIEYEDGGPLEYDDNDNIIIYDSGKSNPNKEGEVLGYIALNAFGVYEFYLYEQESDIVSNTGSVLKQSAGGWKKLGKKIGDIFSFKRKKRKPTLLEWMQFQAVLKQQQELVNKIYNERHPQLVKKSRGVKPPRRRRGEEE